MVVFGIPSMRAAGGRSTEAWASAKSNFRPRPNRSIPRRRSAVASALWKRCAPPWRPITRYGCPQSSRSSTVCESGRAVSSTSWPSCSSSSTSGRRTGTCAVFVKSTQTRIAVSAGPLRDDRVRRPRIDPAAFCATRVLSHASQAFGDLLLRDEAVPAGHLGLEGGLLRAELEDLVPQVAPDVDVDEAGSLQPPPYRLER